MAKTSRKMNTFTLNAENVIGCLRLTVKTGEVQRPTILPAKSDSDVVLCLQSYQGLILERSLVY